MQFASRKFHNHFIDYSNFATYAELKDNSQTFLLKSGIFKHSMQQ